MSKNYDGLTPEERFRLVMKAASRGDNLELERLVNTCPRKIYSEPDAAYVDRVLAADKITAAYLMGLEYQHGKLEGLDMIESALETIPGLAEDLFETAYRRGYQDAGGEEPPEEDLEELREDTAVVMRLVRRLFALARRGIGCRLRIDVDVFNKVCRERMGVEPEDVLADAQEVLSWIDLDALDNAGADVPGLEEFDLDKLMERLDLREDRELMESLYVSAWDRATGREQ